MQTLEEVESWGRFVDFICNTMDEIDKNLPKYLIFRMTGSWTNWVLRRKDKMWYEDKLVFDIHAAFCPDKLIITYNIPREFDYSNPDDFNPEKIGRYVTSICKSRGVVK
jgi:hypothetical protein